MGMTPSEAWEEEAYGAFLEELKRDKDFIEEALEEVSSDNIQSYLGKYGDAIEGRIKECLTQAEKLHKLGFFGPSIVLAATAIEIIIRFLLVRPLVQGAFLSDEWAEILSKRVATGRTAEDRELLPAILRLWGIDITTVKLSNGKGLWETFLTQVRRKRDKFVHKGEHIDSSEAILAIECTNEFLDKIVNPVASKLGFTLETTGKWCEIHKKYALKDIQKSFTPENPF
jgi:hypothetical protein